MAVAGGTVRRGPSRASPARRLALGILRAADGEGAFVNLALDQALGTARLSTPDRALVTELVYGVSRWRGRLDYVLDRLSRHPVAGLPVMIRNILRLSLYQLLFLDRVPARAAVAEGVLLAREFGHPGTVALVNAVLRQAARRGGEVLPPSRESGLAASLAVAFSHPEWLVQRWLDGRGEDATVRLLSVDNEPAPLTLRANLLRTTRENLISGLRTEGVSAEPGRTFPEAVRCRIGTGSIRDLAAYREGLFSVQDEGAMSVARATAPRPGWRVVDACAGVGGKATHLAELMEDRGRVAAIDLFAHKLRLLERSAARLGLGSIETRLLDARELPGTDLAGRADAVLVDAPCTGLGVLRRRPDLRWRVKEEDLTSLTRLQGELLRAAATCVRPGGVLVYAACSLEPEESQEVVEGFLGSNLEFVLDSAPGASGVDAARHGAGPGGRYLAFVPESGGPDGFFVARLVRRCSARVR